MTHPLDYVITLNGKVFIKDGKRPESRIDIEYKKPKLRRLKMGCLNQSEAQDLITELLAKTDDDGWSGLTPEEKKKIITGIVSTHLC